MSIKVRKPHYYDKFSCIGGACTDSCCKEWEIEVDEASAIRFMALPGELGEMLRSSLKIEDGVYVMKNVNGRCPMWREDGLCRIQAAHGEKALCHTCHEFPRIRHDYGDFAELGLELACPEAARYILGGYSEFQYSQELSGDAPDYDRDVMKLLLESREELRAILRDERYGVGERLAIALIFAYHVQNLLDGGEGECFNVHSALEQARDFAAEASYEPVLEFFSGLELLSPEWGERLKTPLFATWQRRHIYLAEYFMDRYWLQSSYDLDLVCRAKLMVISCLAVKLLGGDIFTVSQRYSKEVENNMDNVEALLDAAYSCPAFTDNRLLGLLLK